MSSMKDVPSTERMVMCSQRWKLLKQGEKDAYQKRCEQVCNALLICCILSSVWNINLNKPTWIQMNVYQSLTYFCSTQRKKDYEIEMNRYLLVSILLWCSAFFCTIFCLVCIWNMLSVNPRVSRRRNSREYCQNRRWAALKREAEAVVLLPKRRTPKQRSVHLSVIFGNLKD